MHCFHCPLDSEAVSDTDLADCHFQTDVEPHLILAGGFQRVSSSGGLRRYALDQFGYMAAIVLKNWGITTTGDFGEIVYNMIRVEQMRKSPNDRREHFDDVYDFDQVFNKGFRIQPPSA